MAIAYGAVLDGININSYIAVYYYYCSLLRFYGSVPLSSELTSVVSSKKVITLPTNPQKAKEFRCHASPVAPVALLPRRRFN